MSMLSRSSRCLLSAPSSYLVSSSSSSSSTSTFSSIRRFQTSTNRKNQTESFDSSTSLPGSQPSPSPSTSSTSSTSSFRPSASSIRGSNSNRPPHRLHVQSSRNNTILTLTTSSGDPLASSSGGTAGFKKAQRSGYEAAYRAAFQMFNSIGSNRIKWGLNHIEIIWKGFGQGREAVFRALMSQEGEQVKMRVEKMIDATPIKVGGVRPKKRRML